MTTLDGQGTTTVGGSAGGNLEAALEHARRGWVIIPLWPWKVPHASRDHPEKALLGRGFDMATVGATDEDQVRDWWGREPDAGVGIVTGARSRLLVIDVDVKGDADGEAWLARWEMEEAAEGRMLPEAPVAWTPSGGSHIYLLLPEGVTVPDHIGWLPGVDVKGDGGWVAAPPTPGYRWFRERDVPEAPGWLLDDIRSAPRTGSGMGGRGGTLIDPDVYARLRGDETAPIPNGVRDGYLTKRIADLRRSGASRAELEAVMRREHTRLDQPAGREFKWEWVVVKIERAWERLEPGATAEEVRAFMESRRPDGPVATPDGDVMAGYTLAELRTEPDVVEWLVRGFWLHPTYGMLAGAEKTLKSTLATFLAVAVASGKPLFDARLPVEKAGPVLVFSGEGSRRLYRRRAEHVARSMHLAEEDIDALPITVVEETADVRSDYFQRSVRHWLDETGAVLFILDPMYTYHGSDVDPSNVHAVGPMLNEVWQPCRDRNVSLVIVNHTTKAAAKGEPSLTDITQAGPREWSHSWVLVWHRQDGDLGSQSFRLGLKVGTREGFGTVWNLDLSLGALDMDTLRHVGAATWSLWEGQPITDGERRAADELVRDEKMYTLLRAVANAEDEDATSNKAMEEATGLDRRMEVPSLTNRAVERGLLAVVTGAHGRNVKRLTDAGRAVIGG